METNTHIDPVSANKFLDWLLSRLSSSELTLFREWINFKAPSVIQRANNVEMARIGEVCESILESIPEPPPLPHKVHLHTD